MKVVPAGVQIGGLPVGGLTSEQARNAISWWYNRPLRFVFYGKHWTVRPSVFAASVDSDWAVQRVLRARPNEHLELRTEADSDAIQRYVRALDGRLAVEPVDATASLKGLRPVVEPGKPGLELNRVKTAQRIETLLAIARRPQSVHPVARTVAPSVTANGFGAVVVIYRGSNELHLYRGSKPWRTFGVATGQAIYPTPTGDWHVVDMQPLVAPARLALGEGPEARPAGAGQPARHPLDGPRCVRRGHARHARRGLDRLLGLARLHPHAHPGRRVAVRPRPHRDTGLHPRRIVGAGAGRQGLCGSARRLRRRELSVPRLRYLLSAGNAD
jgi:hypothetical protein